MTCDEVQAEVVGFQLGVLEGAARDAVEAHLPTCPECVRAFLTVKRGVELAEEAPAPSELTGRRVRAAVARELGLSPRPRWGAPLAWAVAASVVVLAVSAVGHLAHDEGSAPHGWVARGG